ncbi:MAG: FTR1 family iron permease [Jiangellaceae bacterium]
MTAFVIMLREGFEAALVVAILVAWVRRTGRPELRGPLWWGVATAVTVSAAVGVGIHLGVEHLAGPDRLRAFAAISVVAVAVLTWMVLWMRRHARDMRGDLQAGLERAVTATRDRVAWAVAAAAFFAVVREGLEASLFLLAVSVGASGPAVLLGGLAGLALAGTLGWLVVIGGMHIPMRLFFRVTGVVLIVFAAGLVARAVMFLQASGDLGSALLSLYDLTGTAWLTQGTEIGRFLGALLGWDPRPSLEQAALWLLYLAPVLALFLRPMRSSGVRTAITSPEPPRTPR